MSIYSTLKLQRSLGSYAVRIAGETTCSLLDAQMAVEKIITSIPESLPRHDRDYSQPSYCFLDDIKL